jgi:outer membrane immunogenic protein
MDRWLVYATGGLAIANFNSSFNWVETNPAPGAVVYSGSNSTTRTGWAVGGGVEYAFAQNWSAKFEMLYLDFGTYTVVAPLQTAPPTVVWHSDVHARDTVARVGLNYKFY